MNKKDLERVSIINYINSLTYAEKKKDLKLTDEEIILFSYGIWAKPDELEGGSIFSDAWEYIRRPFEAIATIGNQQMPRAVKSYLDKNGDYRVRSISVNRNPIDEFINQTLNLVSDGEFEKKKRELNVEKMFHLFMNVGLEGKTGYTVVEKNDVLNIADAPQGGKTAEAYLTIDLRGKNITLRQLVEGGFRDLEKQGLNPYNYNGVNNNCQRFLEAIVNAAGLLTPEISDFIVQDTQKIIGELPGVAKMVAEGAITVKQFINTLLGGRLGSKYKKKK